MKSIKLLTIILCMFLYSCSDSPNHVVVAGNQNMTVYSKADNAIEPIKNGKYKYYITDATGKGWTLFTNSEYELGDVLVIIVEK